MELLAYKATGTDGHCVARIITLWILLKRHPEHTAHVVDCFAVLLKDSTVSGVMLEQTNMIMIIE